jgi:hypothetical protein
MPEGDTLFRTAAGLPRALTPEDLQRLLVGRRVTAARARVPGAEVRR